MTGMVNVEEWQNVMGVLAVFGGTFLVVLLGVKVRLAMLQYRLYRFDNAGRLRAARNRK